LASDIYEDVDIVAVIGGSFHREMSYGKDIPVVYINPNKSTYDRTKNAKGRAMISLSSTWYDKVAVIQKDFWTVERAEVITTAMKCKNFKSKSVGKIKIMWIGINVWWYIGSRIIDVTKPGDIVFAEGFRIHSQSCLMDLPHIIRAVSSGFVFNDYEIDMHMATQTDKYQHTARSIMDYDVYSNGI